MNYLFKRFGEQIWVGADYRFVRVVELLSILLQEYC